LGQELARDGIPHHDYSDWIQTYSSGDFNELAEELESLVDRCSTINDMLHSTYRYAMLCEHDFFASAYT
jgi:thiaminase (transcriptional activator TenA)